MEGPRPLQELSMISNADDGVIVSWSTRYRDGSISAHLTTVSSAGVTDAPGPVVPGSYVYPVAPVLQRQNGTFVGIVMVGTYYPGPSIPHMVAFSASGTILWDVPNTQPMIATADNGVIEAHGTIYDENGVPNRGVPG